MTSKRNLLHSILSAACVLTIALTLLGCAQTRQGADLQTKADIARHEDDISRLERSVEAQEAELRALRAQTSEMREVIARLDALASLVRPDSAGAKPNFIDQVQRPQPGSAASSASAAPTSDSSTRPSPKPQVSGGQCTAITQKGTRCKRNASPGSSTCWQH